MTYSFINDKVCCRSKVACRDLDGCIWKLVTTWSWELFDDILFSFKSNEACKSVLTRNRLCLALTIRICNRCHTIRFKESKYRTGKVITLFIYLTNSKGVKFQFRIIHCWWSWWDDLIDKGFLRTVWNNCLDSVWCFIFCDGHCDIHLTFVILDICLISWHDFFNGIFMSTNHRFRVGNRIKCHCTIRSILFCLKNSSIFVQEVKAKFTTLKVTTF